VAAHFGTCELDVERRELRRDGKVVPVEPQVFDVLAYLLDHRDRVVPKTELLDEVWGDRFVSESALTSRIKSARRAVGDTGRDQRVVKTVHSRGYRFVAELVGTEGTDGSGDEAEPAADRPVEDRVLDDLIAGRGTALRIEGGDRMTRGDVLQRLARAARARGVAVGQSAPSLTHSDPFACAVEALDEMTQRGPDLLDALPGALRAELEQAFGEGLPTTRQRWLVAARELLMVAAERSGALLLVDDVDHASLETLALIDDIARLTRGHRIAVVVAGRPQARAGTGPGWFDVVELPPSDASATTVPDVPAEVAEALALVALSGDRFDDLELRAATGHDGAAGQRVVEEALAAGAIVPDAGGYRFAEGVDVAGLAAGLPPAERARALERTARGLAGAGAPPERVAEHFLAAGRRSDAAPFALAAARRAAAVQLHRDVLRWTDAARDHLSGEDEAELLALRAEALAARSDPAAVAAFRTALAASPPERARRLRAQMARAALFTGDVASAQEAVAGLEPEDGPDDAAVLYVQGLLAYYTGDIDGAEAAVDEARRVALDGSTQTQLLDAITLQGMVAHNRGLWFDRLGREMRATSESPALAATVFDSHLCVAEYLLYGPTPYPEVIDLAYRLRDQADEMGTRAAAAFATLVAGEAALLAGDLDQARADLTEAVEMHVALDAGTGTAHALQRLAEVELAAGDPAEAERLLRRALTLARWSPLARHLLQRIYGTLVAAAPDREAALALVDEALEASDERHSCVLCHVMIAVPATIACAEGGRLDEARDWLRQAERSARLWRGTAWRGAACEARAHLCRAEGDPAEAERLLAEAADMFDAAGQPLDAQRCREAADLVDR
jgi:DNA-binding winged helix-turn-helix (wHTH) protein/tetratricopeptide (TPR) repeat protein